MVKRLRFISFMAMCLAGSWSKDSQTLPEVHPEKGKVTSDVQPVSGGFLRFMLENNADYIVSGDVNANGDFEIQTIMKDKRIKGAPAGKYTITYTPPGTDQRNLPITPKRAFVIDANTNEIVVELKETNKDAT